MKRRVIFLALCFLVSLPVALYAFPTVYPHGTTIYKPDKCFNGYTVLPTKGSATVVIDMNGNVVKQWKNVCVEEHPAKLLPGGIALDQLLAPVGEVEKAQQLDCPFYQADGILHQKRLPRMAVDNGSFQ